MSTLERRTSQALKTALPLVGWLTWCIFLAVYLAALAQFYSQGLHLLPGDAFTYAGDPVGNPRPSHLPVAPTPEEVYGTSEWASLALSSLTYGCLSLPVLGLLFVVVLTRWRTYSLLGKGLRIAVVLLTITALVFGRSTWFLPVFWGLGD